MNVSKTDLDQAAARVPILPEQIDALWRELQKQAGASAASAGSSVKPSRFDASHLAYYFGALIVLGAMSWFMTLAWEIFGGAGIFGIALCYMALFAYLGRLLWRNEQTRTPGGLLYTIAVAMTPLAVYGLERWLGWWPSDDPGAYAGFHVWVKGGWIVMELATVLVGVATLRRVPFPFLTAPIAFALWYLSMDLAPLAYGGEFGWDQRLWVSLFFGLAMLLAAYLVDIRRGWRGPDFGFWLSFFGLMAFWGGLSLMKSDSELGRLFYCLINVGLMFLGVLLDRRAFAVFGALGVNGYIGYLAYRVFQDSLLFPFVLSGLGLLIIAMGIFYQRRRSAWRQAVLNSLPPGWRRLAPGEDPAA
jgi:hypothetical protein